MSYKPEVIDKIGLDIMKARDIANENQVSIEINIRNFYIDVLVHVKEKECKYNFWRIEDLYHLYDSGVNDISAWVKEVCKGDQK